MSLGRTIAFQLAITCLVVLLGGSEAAQARDEVMREMSIGGVPHGGHARHPPSPSKSPSQSPKPCGTTLEGQSWQ